MSQRTHLSRALVVGLCTLSGCLDSCGDDNYYDPTPGPGELGKGDFHYRCVGDDDPACLDGSDIGNFPARVAVGGRFRLSYTWEEPTSPAPELRSGAPERLGLTGEIFTALAPGYTAVLALVGNSDVGDLIHIFASEPTMVVIQRDRIDYAELKLVVGEEAQLDAITRDDSGYTLAGTLDFGFSVDDPAVAEIVGTASGHMMLRGVSEGSTRARATFGSLTADVLVTVDAAEGSTTDASTTDASTTDGSSSDGSSSDGSSSDGTSGGSSSGGSSTGGVL